MRSSPCGAMLFTRMVRVSGAVCSGQRPGCMSWGGKKWRWGDVVMTVSFNRGRGNVGTVDRDRQSCVVETPWIVVTETCRFASESGPVPGTEYRHYDLVGQATTRYHRITRLVKREGSDVSSALRGEGCQMCVAGLNIEKQCSVCVGCGPASAERIGQPQTGAVRRRRRTTACRSDASPTRSKGIW